MYFLNCIAPNTDLYFMLNSALRVPDEAIAIADIGADSGADPGASLVCVTANVNTQCCGIADGGVVGEWYFPNGTLVSHNTTANITISSFTGQVRLNRRNNATLPTGLYECRVPAGNGTLQVARVALLKGA